MSHPRFKSDFTHEPPTHEPPDLRDVPLITPFLSCIWNSDKGDTTSRSPTLNSAISEVPFSSGSIRITCCSSDSLQILAHPQSGHIPPSTSPSTFTNVLSSSHNEDDLNDVVRCSLDEINCGNPLSSTKLDVFAKGVSIMDEENIFEKIDAEDNEFIAAVDPDHEKENNNATPRKRAYDGIVPCTGMEFASLEEFERSYYTYAQSEGFTVRIKKTLKFDHSDKIRYHQYVCSCAGFSEEKRANDEADVDQEKTSRKTLTRRSGCPVTITISKKRSVWKVGSINNQHDHLLVSPNSRTHLKQPGGLPAVAKNLVEKFSKSDLPIERTKSEGFPLDFF